MRTPKKSLSVALPVVESCSAAERNSGWERARSNQFRYDKLGELEGIEVGVRGQPNVENHRTARLFAQVRWIDKLGTADSIRHAIEVSTAVKSI